MEQIAQEMAPQYPEVTTDYMFVDNAAMKMIQEPKFFDVMVTENTFGDILTDEALALPVPWACCRRLLRVSIRLCLNLFMVPGRKPRDRT